MIPAIFSALGLAGVVFAIFTADPLGAAVSGLLLGMVFEYVAFEQPLVRSLRRLLEEMKR